MLAEMLGGLGGAALGAVSDTLSAPRRYLMQSLGLPETGADLIAHTTGLNTEDMGLAGHALNFGAEALTDPLTLGGGALTRLLGKGLTAGAQGLRAMANMNHARITPSAAKLLGYNVAPRSAALAAADEVAKEAMMHGADAGSYLRGIATELPRIGSADAIHGAIHPGGELPKLLRQYDSHLSSHIYEEMEGSLPHATPIIPPPPPPPPIAIGEPVEALGKGTAGSAFSVLRRNRSRFAMIKNVVPAEIERAEEMGRVFTKGGFGSPAEQAMADFAASRPQTRVTGGTGAQQDQARFIAKPSLQDAERSAGQYMGTPGVGATRANVFSTPDPSSPLNGLRLSAEPMPRVVRHEGIHGMIDQAAKSGDTSGLPLLMRVPAELYHGTRGMDESLRRGLGRVTDELAAQTLQHRGLSAQLQGAQNFLLPLTEKGQQVRDIYAHSFAQTSPLAAAIYKYGPPAAAMLGYYGALGGGLNAAGLLE